jgi:NADH-quinone oxidoreductase subunit M
VLVPLVLCILALALFPQTALEKGEAGVVQAVRPAAQVASPPPQPAAAPPVPGAPGAAAVPGEGEGGTIQIDPSTGQPVAPQEVPTP